MDVLLLWMVNAGYLGPVELVIPGVRVDVSASARSLVQLFSLIHAHLLRVNRHLQSAAVWLHRCSLDGAVDQFLGVGGRAGGDGVDVVGQFLGHSLEGLLSDYSGDGGDRFRHLILL